MNTVMSRTKAAARGAPRALGLCLLAVLPGACDEPTGFPTGFHTGFEETIVQALAWTAPQDGAEAGARQVAAAAPREIKGLRLDLGGGAGTVYLRLSD